MYLDKEMNPILTKEELDSRFRRASISKIPKETSLESWEYFDGKHVSTFDIETNPMNGVLYVDINGIEIFDKPCPKISCHFCKFKLTFYGHWRPAELAYRHPKVNVAEINMPSLYAPILYNQNPFPGFSRMQERNPMAPLKVLWCLEHNLWPYEEYSVNGYGGFANFYCPACGTKLEVEI